MKIIFTMDHHRLFLLPVAVLDAGSNATHILSIDLAWWLLLLLLLIHPSSSCSNTVGAMPSVSG